MRKQDRALKMKGFRMVGREVNQAEFGKLKQKFPDATITTARLSDGRQIERAWKR